MNGNRNIEMGYSDRRLKRSPVQNGQIGLKWWSIAWMKTKRENRHREYFPGIFSFEDRALLQ